MFSHHSVPKVLFSFSIIPCQSISLLLLNKLNNSFSYLSVLPQLSPGSFSEGIYSGGHIGILTQIACLPWSLITERKDLRQRWHSTNDMNTHSVHTME